jgi:carbon monoxide dehydrogenase subunit G
MDLENEFTVPLPVDEDWPVLLDVERVAPCMPGATLLTHDGDDFTGTVKVKIGPVQMTYKGSAKFVETDADAHRAVIEASGKDTRGGGTAAATVTLLALPDGDSTKVKVTTDLNITGRPAQFGRGVLAEVSGKLVDQFAGSLAKEMTKVEAVVATAESNGHAAPTDASADHPPASAPARPSAPPPAEAIDLLSVAGGSVVKRLVPLAGVVAGVLLLLLRRRRRA